MRFTCLAAALMLLAACATAPTPATTTAPAPEAAVTSSRAAQLLATAGRAGAATQAEVEGVLGRADIARQTGAGAAWTYRFEHCGLLLLFEADAHNALRLAEAHPSARRVGEVVPSLDQCAAEAPAH